MESPITPEELQAEIRRMFRAAKRREVTGLLVLLVGLLLILFVGIGFIWTEFSASK